MAAYGKGADPRSGTWELKQTESGPITFLRVLREILYLSSGMVVLPGISDQRFVTNGIGRRFYVPIRNLQAFQPRSQPTGKPSQSVSPAGGKSLVQDLQSETPLLLLAVFAYLA